MLTTAPLTITKTENQPEHPSVNKRVFKVVEKHDGIHSSKNGMMWTRVKKNGMTLGNITLREISDFLEYHCMVSCKRVLRKRWPRGTKEKRVVPRG